MKAAVHERYGAPDVVHVIDVEPPSPGTGEVLIEVHASTVNRTDCGFRAAKPAIVRLAAGLRRPRRTVLGCDLAGVVAAVGDGVTTFAVGDRVFGFDDAWFGGHGELAIRRADRGLGTIPEGTSFAEAASTTEGTHYAESFMRVAKLRPGQRVLVNGATGAIGVGALQLAKRAGAHVTAVCEGEHAELVRRLGADRVFDRTTEDFTRGDETYDAVLDAVGKSSFGRCKHLLAPRGVYVSSELGPYGMNPVLGLVTPLFRRRHVRFPIPRKPTPEEGRRLAAMIAAGEIQPVIDRRCRLEEIADAYRYVESGRKIGSVVITLRDDA